MSMHHSKKEIEKQLEQIANFPLVRSKSVRAQWGEKGELIEISFIVEGRVISDTNNTGSKPTPYRGCTKVDVPPVKVKFILNRSLKFGLRFLQVKRGYPVHPNVQRGKACGFHVQFFKPWKEKDILQLAYGSLLFLNQYSSINPFMAFEPGKYKLDTNN